MVSFTPSFTLLTFPLNCVRWHSPDSPDVDTLHLFLLPSSLFYLTDRICKLLTLSFSLHYRPSSQIRFLHFVRNSELGLNRPGTVCASPALVAVSRCCGFILLHDSLAARLQILVEFIMQACTKKVQLPLVVLRIYTVVYTARSSLTPSWGQFRIWKPSLSSHVCGLNQRGKQKTKCIQRGLYVCVVCAA